MSNYKKKNLSGSMIVLIIILLLIPVEIIMVTILDGVQPPGEFFAITFFIMSCAFGGIIKANIEDNDLANKLDLFTIYATISLIIDIPLVIVIMFFVLGDFLIAHDLSKQIWTMLYILTLIWGFSLVYQQVERKKKS